MKFYSILALFIFFSNGYSQDLNTPVITTYQKGDFFLSWGYNWSWYSNSDIKFKGDHYHFELKSVKAADRPTRFNLENYFHPSNLTTPQYNFRMGYFVNDRYSISLGIDHMKYIAIPNQSVVIYGEIQNSGTLYDGVYNGESILLEEGFLEFEHTDGLNYINAELRKADHLLVLHEKIKLHTLVGVGFGAIYPRTNAVVLNNARYDQFNVAGYGLHGLFGLGFTFFKNLRIQTELKGGYINLPKVRTTSSTSDSASHSFFFGQYNVSIGGTFNIL